MCISHRDWVWRGFTCTLLKEHVFGVAWVPAGRAPLSLHSAPTRQLGGSRTVCAQAGLCLGPVATLALSGPADPIPDVSLTAGPSCCSEHRQLGWQELLSPLHPQKATTPKIAWQRSLVLHVIRTCSLSPHLTLGGVSGTLQVPGAKEIICRVWKDPILGVRAVGSI